MHRSDWPLTVSIGWRLGALLLCAALLLPGCDSGGGGEPRARRGAAEHLVVTAPAILEATQAVHERPATLRYRRVLRLFSQEEGRLIDFTLYEGDPVARDQILVQLDAALIRAELDKARATLEQARLDLGRLRDLQRGRAASESEVAAAATAVEVATAEVRLLETRLGYTAIRAPFPAIVLERLVEPGDFVTKGTHLLTMADPLSLIAETRASELLLPALRVGDPARLRIDALGAEIFAARILRVHPSVETSSRQGIVELTLEPIPPGAKAGQFARVTLSSAAVERLLVPFRAVRRDRDGELVWTLDSDGRAERRAVRTGLRIGDQVEILDGLTAGEPVIARGFLGLNAGQLVTPVAFAALADDTETGARP